jgi:hypothetical protein
MKHLSKWLFRDPEKKLFWWQVIVWWEIRRVPLNIFLIVFGALAHSLIMSIGSPIHNSMPMPDHDRPTQELATDFLLLFNILYAGGWIFEILAWPVLKSWILRGPEKTPPWYRTIIWWEIRRIPFNVIIVSLIVLSCFIFAFIPSPTEFSLSSLGILSSRAMTTVMLIFNALYTGGWIFEILVRLFFREKSTTLGPDLFCVGLVLTAFLVVLPTLLAVSFSVYELFFQPYCPPGCGI